MAMPFNQSPQSGAARYNMNATTLSSTAFVIQAAPTGSQTADACGTLQIDQSGNKSVVGASRTAAECWNR